MKIHACFFVGVVSMFGALSVQAASTGWSVAAERIDPTPYKARIALRVPTATGPIVMVDYASVDCWKGGHVQTWLPTP